MSRAPQCSGTGRSLASRRCPSGTASQSGAESVSSGCSEIWDKENRQSVIPPRTDMYSAVRVAWREHFEELPLRNDLATPRNESGTSCRPDTARLLAEQQAYWVNSRRSVRHGMARLQYTGRLSAAPGSSIRFTSHEKTAEDEGASVKTAKAEDNGDHGNCSQDVAPVPRYRYRSLQADIYR